MNIRNRKVISGLHTFLLRSKNDLIADGFKGYIHSNKLVKKQMDTLATGLKVYGVTKTNLKKIQIPLPPTRTEQIAITDSMQSWDGIFDTFPCLNTALDVIDRLWRKDLALNKKENPSSFSPENGCNQILLSRNRVLHKKNQEFSFFPSRKDVFAVPTIFLRKKKWDFFRRLRWSWGGKTGKRPFSLLLPSFGFLSFIFSAFFFLPRDPKKRVFLSREIRGRKC